MKKVFLLLVITGFLFSCVNKQSNTEQLTEEYILKTILDSCLEKQPNAMNNDITRSILADSIKATIQCYIGDSLPFLSNIPLKYEMALEYLPSPFDFESESFKNAGKYVVKFSFSESSNKCELSKEYQTTFQIFTIMDKEAVATLIDGALYYVNGKFIDFANNSKETGFVLPSGKCLVDYPSISRSALDNKPFINLGTLIIENATFIPIE